jgi:hypothetical protein
LATALTSAFGWPRNQETRLRRQPRDVNLLRRLVGEHEPDLRAIDRLGSVGRVMHLQDDVVGARHRNSVVSVIE